MNLPATLREQVRSELGEIDVAVALPGGSISRALRVEIDGAPRFLKFETAPPPRFFAVEVEGLRALATASDGSVTVPEVLAFREDPESGGWLALEWLEPAAGTPDFESLGRGLARIHRASADQFGWHQDGYIGSLRQSNTWTGEWGRFWWTHRLEPQIKTASTAGLLRWGQWDQLADRVEELLSAVSDPPSLLHGDLWGGNVLAGKAGPAIFDPSVYFGHREVDLAMAALFGGFGDAFFRAYEASWPVAGGSAPRRKVYQLYYLLVHVNLFGASYVPRTEATMQAIVDKP